MNTDRSEPEIAPLADPVATRSLVRYENGNLVPVNMLDNVLTFDGYNPTIGFHSFLDGDVISDDNELAFQTSVRNNAVNRRYPTTDHLFTSVRFGVRDPTALRIAPESAYGLQTANSPADADVASGGPEGATCGDTARDTSDTSAGAATSAPPHVALFVSLDNSVRSNAAGHPLKSRLPALCEAVRGAIERLGGEAIVFFSESCRASFDGGDRVRQPNRMSWFEIRRAICVMGGLRGLEYLGECTNNEDASCMSFGMSAFCTPGYVQWVDDVLPRRIATAGPAGAGSASAVGADSVGSASGVGAQQSQKNFTLVPVRPGQNSAANCSSDNIGAVGVKLRTGEIVWGVHFPLDFERDGDANSGAWAMRGLARVMNSYPGSYCALGDFNTIPGRIEPAVRGAIPAGMRFAATPRMTFYGSYYDTIPDDGAIAPLLRE
jgi:hypothetical protein